MSRYNSRFMKAQIGLAILVIIGVMIMGVFLIFEYISVLIKVVDIKGEAQLFIEIEDKGSSIVALLHAKKHNLSYSEILGDCRASNYKDIIEEEMNALEETLGKTSKIVGVYDEGNNLVCGSDIRDTVDIALPGGFKGRFGIE